MVNITYDGEATFEIPAADKACVTHFWVSGCLKSGQTPLVVMHGGPGIGHNYLVNLIQLTAKHGVPVVLYDQLGTGLSTHLPEKDGDTSFWTIELFISELENLIVALGIQDCFDLMGHSWGGMVVSRFAARRPKGLRRLVLVSPIAAMEDWVQASLEWQKELPREVQDVIQKHESEQTTEHKEYHEAVNFYYRQHLCRIQPWPESLVTSFGWVQKDPTVFRTMLGTSDSEFIVTGPLKDVSIVSELHKIEVPTLVTNGRYDGATDNVVVKFFDHIPKAKWVQFAESSHTPHIEETGRFLNVLGSFLATL